MTRSQAQLNNAMSPASHIAGRLGLIVLTTFAVVLSGLAAATANFLIVGALIGLLGGAFLLIRPTAAVTLIIGVGLTMGVVISTLGPGFDKLTWLVALLGFFLLIPALLQAQHLKSAPAYIHVLLAFLLFAVATTFLQWHSIAEVAAGFKRYFQATGLLLALAILPFKDRDYSDWRRLVVMIAFLQLPFALYELLVLVPKRGGLEAGSAVTDVIAGTFGANLRGGSPNSAMALLLLLVLAFVLSHWKEGLLKSRHVLVALPLCLAPIAMGEVKIAFVIIPLMLLVMFRRELTRRPAAFIGMLLIGSLTMLALGAIYVEFIIKRPLSSIVHDSLAYNIRDIGYGQYFLNRTTVFTFWWQQQGFHDPLGFFFGHGLGSSFTSTQNLAPGHIAIRWPMHGIDLTAASTLLWDTGLLGLAIFLGIFWAAWRTCNTLLNGTLDRYSRAEITAIQGSIPMFFIFVFYNNMLINLLAMEIIFSMTLGYLAYQYRKHGPNRSR